MVGIGPLDENTGLNGHDTIPYKAIRFHNTQRLAVVGNFPQTGTLYKQTKGGRKSPYGALHAVLHRLVNGQNVCYTPQIGGSVVIGRQQTSFTLGITHPDGPKTILRNHVGAGSALTMSATNSRTEPQFTRARDVLTVAYFKGNDPEDLAEEMFNLRNGLGVASASAVWFSGEERWRAATKDLYS